MPFFTKTIKETKNLKAKQAERFTKYYGGFPEGTWLVGTKIKVVSEWLIRLKYFRGRRKCRGPGYNTLFFKMRKLKFRQGEWLASNHTTRNSKI